MHRRARFASRVVVIASLILASGSFAGFADEKAKKSSGGLGIWGTITFIPMALLWAGVEVVRDFTVDRRPLNERPEYRFRISSVSFSPNGKELIFEYGLPEEMLTFAIWDIASERFTKLPPPPEGRAWRSPTFSVDGTEIIFANCNYQNYCHAAIMSKNGSKVRPLALGPLNDKNNMRFPSVSNDGRKIIYQKIDGIIRDILLGAVYEQNLATGVEKRISPWGVAAYHPQFLPDGRNFVFSGRYNGLNLSDRMIESENYPYGSIDLNEEVSKANWKKRLVEIRDQDMALRQAYRAEYDSNQIFIMGPDYGYDLKPAFVQGRHSERPSISQDGKMITFLATFPDAEAAGPALVTEVFVRTKGQNMQLTDMRGEMSHLVISPDGKRIFFRRTHHTYRGNYYWLINSNGSGLREIRFPGQPKAKK